jgi:RimJ/RimL family protein N-acetyltransferase
MTIIIRTVTLDDVEAVSDHHQGIALETDIDVPLRPSDMPTDRERLEGYIEQFIEPDNSTAIVADVDGKIVGWVTARGGKARVVRHVVDIGIVISRGWRGQGIGTNLMLALIAWARETNIVKRLELDVYTSNDGAIHMYEKLGFITEGCRKKALMHDDDYVDLFHMALLI